MNIVFLIGAFILTAMFLCCFVSGIVSILRGRYKSFIAWMFCAISTAGFAAMFLTGDYSPLEKALKIAINAALTVALAPLIIAFIALAVVISLFSSLI